MLLRRVLYIAGLQYQQGGGILLCSRQILSKMYVLISIILQIQIHSCYNDAKMFERNGFNSALAFLQEHTSIIQVINIYNLFFSFWSFASEYAKQQNIEHCDCDAVVFRSSDGWWIYKITWTFLTYSQKVSLDESMFFHFPKENPKSSCNCSKCEEKMPLHHTI